MKNIIASTLISLVKIYTNSEVPSKIVSNTSEGSVNLVHSSDLFQKAFKSKCNEVIGSRKKSANGSYFYLIKCPTLFSWKSQNANCLLHSTTLSKKDIS